MDSPIEIKLKLLLKEDFVPQSSLEFNTFSISSSKVIPK